MNTLNELTQGFYSFLFTFSAGRQKQQNQCRCSSCAELTVLTYVIAKKLPRIGSVQWVGQNGQDETVANTCLPTPTGCHTDQEKPESSASSRELLPVSSQPKLLLLQHLCVVGLEWDCDMI